jgi:hypothetical protein
VTTEFWIQTIRSAPTDWLKERVRAGIRSVSAMRDLMTPASTALGAAIQALEIDIRLMADELARRGVKYD